MKKANERMVMVLIWTILAVAVSVIVEARGSQTQTISDLDWSNNAAATSKRESTMSSAPGTETRTEQTDEITEANWQRDPRIKDIQKIVGSVNAGLKVHTFKSVTKFPTSP